MLKYSKSYFKLSISKLQQKYYIYGVFEATTCQYSKRNQHFSIIFQDVYNSINHYKCVLLLAFTVFVVLTAFSNVMIMRQFWLNIYTHIPRNHELIDTFSKMYVWKKNNTNFTGCSDIIHFWFFFFCVLLLHHSTFTTFNNVANLQM